MRRQIGSPRAANAARILSLTLLAFGLLASCFGDNQGGAALRLSAPDELDGGDTAELTISVDGAANNEEVNVELSASTGTLSSAGVVVVTDAQGHGSVSVQYTAANETGPATINAAASAPRLGTVGATKQIKLYEVTRVGNVTPITNTVKEQDYLTAFPINIPTNGTLRKLGVVAPEPATVVIGLYDNTPSIDGDTPNAALARGELSLAAGVNELIVEPRALSAGKYWIVVTYNGEATTARDAINLVTGRTLTDYSFGRGLPDTLPSMNLTTNMGERNLYIVLRR
ncbi:MAG: hypothetical protein R3B48_29195 [Kofleriaceae bacterium]